jgi:hypothetical protein
MVQMPDRQAGEALTIKVIKAVRFSPRSAPFTDWTTTNRLGNCGPHARRQDVQEKAISGWKQNFKPGKF